jgi:hypothetical protein
VMPRVEGLQGAQNRQSNSGNRRKRKWCLLSRPRSRTITMCWPSRKCCAPISSVTATCSEACATWLTKGLSEYFQTALDCPKGVPGLTMLQERADRLKSATAVGWLTRGVRLWTALLVQAAVPRCLRGHALGAAHLRTWAVRSPASLCEWAKTAG